MLKFIFICNINQDFFQASYYEDFQAIIVFMDVSDKILILSLEFDFLSFGYY